MRPGTTIVLLALLVALGVAGTVFMIQLLSIQ